MRKIMWMVLLALCLLPCAAFTDEFSGKSMDEAWMVLDLAGSNIVSQQEGCLAINTVEGSQQNATANTGVKVLRKALQGEWIIETDQIETTIHDQESLHGLVIWADENNYIVLGTAGKRAKVQGVIGGQDTGLIARESAMRYMRVRKITRGKDYATYHFYVGGSGYQSLQWIGQYEDTTHALDEAMYGLLSASALEGGAVYDSFTERLPIGEFDAFIGRQPDGIWELGTGVKGTLSKSLRLSGTEEALPQLALRYGFCEDWVIDTNLLYRPDTEAINGLLVARDERNFLLFGARGNDQVTAIMCRNGAVQELAAIESDHCRFLIMKEGDKYILCHSRDASEWMELCCYADDQGILKRARYGFGCWGDALAEVSYGFFRERQTPDGQILGVKCLTEIAQVLGRGEEVINNTSEIKFLGADLGHFLDAGDRVYQMFGDSNTSMNQAGTFWSNSLAVIEDDDPSDGLTFSRIISDPDGTPKEVIKSRHINYDEVTCIPNTGVIVGDRIYYHYMSVHHWMPEGHWDVNGSGWAWSDDGGENFTREPLCFAGDSGFIITCALKQDDYIYLYGTPSSKFEGVRLARFREEDILDESKYEYCTGEDENGNTLWSPHVKDAVEVIPGCTGEFCVIYHPQIDRYLMLNQNVHTMDIELRESACLTGGFGAPVTLVDHTIPRFNEYVYSPNTLSRYLADDGRSMYFTMTRWNPYMVYWEKAELLLREAE